MVIEYLKQIDTEMDLCHKMHDDYFKKLKLTTNPSDTDNNDPDDAIRNRPLDDSDDIIFK